MRQTQLLFAILTCSAFSWAQGNPKLEPATAAVLRAFRSHEIVMFGEIHGNKQEYEWLRSLVSTPAFADTVDDIVVEFGNSLYQKSVDGYVSGEDVPLKQVQKAWLNLAGAIGPPSPVYASLYRAIRDMNLKRRGKHQMRIVCGDPYIDWQNIKDREDLGPFLTNRDQWYVQILRDEVLAKHHRSLLIMGWGHFLRRPGPAYIEQQLRAAGARTYLIVFGTNCTGSYDQLDHRLDTWPAPVIVALTSNWVGDLPAMPVVSGGSVALIPFGRGPGGAAANSAPPQKLSEVADALLYVGPRDSLTQLYMPRAELDGTPYGKEIARRLTIEFGGPGNFIHDKEEEPQFTPPRAGTGGGPRLGSPPKSIHDPLPPRPVPQ